MNQPVQISSAIADEVIAMIEELRESNKQLKQHVKDLQEALNAAQPVSADDTKDASLNELKNIADAKRFDRAMFRDDSEFADWAQSRCRHAIAQQGDGK